MRQYLTSQVINSSGVGSETSVSLLQAHFDYTPAPLFIRIAYSVGGEFKGFDILDDLSIPNGYHSQLVNAIKFNRNLYRQMPIVAADLMISNINTGGYNLPLLASPVVPYTMDIYLFSLVTDLIEDVNIAQTWYTGLTDRRVPVTSAIGSGNTLTYIHK